MIEERFDENHQTSYFFNTSTGNSAWVRQEVEQPNQGVLPGSLLEESSVEHKQSQTTWPISSISEQELIDAFEFFDMDSNGKIGSNDLMESIEHLNLQHLPHLNKMGSITSLEGLPEITMKEFRDVVRDELLRETGVSVDPLVGVLTHFESPGGEGEVDQELLAESLNKAWVNEVPQEDIDALLQTADANSDGRITRTDLQDIFAHVI